MNEREIIEKARKGFDEDFAKKNYMENRTGDDKHLNVILNSLDIASKSKILDLGTGNGYLAFPIAKINNESEVIGLDIAVKTLIQNREKAYNMRLKNLNFVDYNGVKFPFENNVFDYVVTRYALHHFPNINKTFEEVSRVVKPGGVFFISDPTPNENDDIRFIDTYMQMKDDGHVKFYTKGELIELAEKYNFKFVNSFDSEIRFSSNRTRKYLSVANTIDKHILDSYKIDVINGETYITEQVMNLIFIKQ
ncbi:class I SAM-dependent methyltransferase [Clostridium sp.]|uniref:class I SAM-dependent methyltransferase n=1 Tax=Clostridium sp. TaxID=1506 RepID=UPI00263487C6|nr:class I SAM-dependent methyltransferase [Clostridium sp.]